MNLETVKAKAVAFNKPQQVLAKLIKFLVRLSVIPTLSRMRAKKYLGNVWYQNDKTQAFRLNKKY